jgi:hypothetical protein
MIPVVMDIELVGTVSPASTEAVFSALVRANHASIAFFVQELAKKRFFSARGSA